MKRKTTKRSSKKVTAKARSGKTGGVILPVDEAVQAIAELYKEGKEVKATPVGNGKYKVQVQAEGDANRQGTTLRSLPDTTGTSDDGPAPGEAGGGDEMQKDPRDLQNEFPEMESNAGMILTKSQARDAMAVLRDHQIKANAEKIGANQYMVIIAEESMPKLAKAQGLDFEVLEGMGGDSPDDPHGNPKLKSGPGSRPEDIEAMDGDDHEGGDEDRVDDDSDFPSYAMDDEMLDMDGDGVPDDMDMSYEGYAMDDDDLDLDMDMEGGFPDLDDNGMNDMLEDDGPHEDESMYASSGWVDEDTAYRAVTALAKHNVTAFVEEQDGAFKVTTAEPGVYAADDDDDDSGDDQGEDNAPQEDDDSDSLEEGTIQMLDRNIGAGADDDDDDKDDDKDDDDDDAEGAFEDDGMLSISGVNYELLAAPEEMEGVSSADVSMELRASDTDNPRWHVDVRGMPVAFIDLKSQDKIDEIYSHFVSEEYGKHLTTAFDTMDARDLLNQVNATWYANKINNATLVATLRDKVEAKLERKHQKAMAKLSDRLIGSIKMAIAGANKNFFPDFDHHLKSALFSSLDEAGVYNPASVIESAFAQGEAPYFEAIIAKAQELMAKPAEVQAELANVIGESGVLSVIEADADDEEHVSLGQHLENSNVPIVAGTSREPLNAKEELRSRLNLGGSGPGR